ncbi:MAG TPA: glutathione S-transferase N-terminal domain-containing protein, partial [Burkholderiales bacterium]
MSALELYFAPGACSFVPHVGLEAAGLSFEPKLVKLHRGESRTPEYLAMNPNGQVPVLVVDGRPLTQIVAICEYIDRA